LNSNETVTLDPPEFAVERTELALDGLGLYIVDADWDDASIELFLVKQRLGEIPSNKRPPNREVKIKVGVKEEGEQDLATAAVMLQQKIGRIGDESGFVKRVPDSRSGSKPVVFQAHSAAIGGLQGWYMAHRQHAPNVELRFNCGPFCYGITPVETGTIADAGAHRYLELLIPKVLGTAPGLVRCQFENGGEADWHGIVLSGESRDYSSADTAKPFYNTEKLDLLGASIKHARNFSSGTEVVRATLTEEWTAILGSKIGGEEDMTHKGVRRLYFRIFNEFTPGNVQLRLEYRANGTTQWSRNDTGIVSTKLSGSYDILDMGECRPELAILGERSWEWRLIARATTEAKTEIDIDCVWIHPTELFTRVSESPSLTIPPEFVARDTFRVAHEGGVTGTAPLVGPGNYIATAGSDADDFKVRAEELGLLQRDAIEDSGATGGFKGRAIGLDVNMSDVNFQFDFFAEHTTLELYHNYQWGSFLKYKDSENFIAVWFEWDFALNLYQIHIKVVAGGAIRNQIHNIPPKLLGTPIPTVVKGRLLCQVIGDVVTVWMSLDPANLPMEIISSLQDSEIGNLAAGDVYLMDTQTKGGVASIRQYSNMSIWGTESESVCYAGMGIEIRSEGVIRQGDGTEVWGKLTPDRGSLPWAPPSGLEDRPLRIIGAPTRGDFDKVGDNGSNYIQGQLIYFPGYHFMTEAG
jgi:hypothetical protein